MKKKDVHQFYSFFDKIEMDSKFNIKLIKTFGSCYTNNIFFVIDVIYLIYIIPYLVLWKRKEFVILREFNTIPFFLNAIILFPFRKKVILNVNHNFQKASISKIHKLCIKFVDFLGYRFLCFESDTTPFNLINEVISIPFPVNSFNYSEFNINNLTLGFVGSYRKEKNIEVLLKALESFDKVFQLILGTDNPSLLDEYSKKGWDTFNTIDFDNYKKATDKVDLLVVNYEKNSYYYRHSGVITDFIQKGKIVIAPNYIYFNDQLTTPVEVGLLFDDVNNIANLIQSNLKHLLKDFGIKLEQYFQYRNFKNVVKSLDEQLTGH